MPTDIENAIATNAQGPKRASGDSGSMEQHPLPDQIAAAKYLAASNAVGTAGSAWGAVRIARVQPPGAV